MNEMEQTIIPKSDQLNSDDLLAGPRTITIREVKIVPGTEQPVGVFFEGDENKPYLPCKSMRRVMVAVWGADASAYMGRSMTIYRDPKVTWGGMEVGGIRISHMSHIEVPTVLVLTATKKARKPFTVLPMAEKKKAATAQNKQDEPDKNPEQKAREWVAGILEHIGNSNEADLHKMAGAPQFNTYRDRLRSAYPAMDQEIADAMKARMAVVSDFPGDQP